MKIYLVTVPLAVVILGLCFWGGYFLHEITADEKLVQHCTAEKLTDELLEANIGTFAFMDIRGVRCVALAIQTESCGVVIDLHCPFLELVPQDVPEEHKSPPDGGKNVEWKGCFNFDQGRGQAFVERSWR